MFATALEQQVEDRLKALRAESRTHSLPRPLPLRALLASQLRAAAERLAPSAVEKGRSLQAGNPKWI
jgi:hypothetical protein